MGTAGAITLVTGTFYGALGHWWSRSRSIVAGALLALPFIIESWLWPVRTGLYQGPLLLWPVETAVGLCLLASITLIGGRRRLSISS